MTEPPDSFAARLRSQLDAGWYLSYYGVAVSEDCEDRPLLALQHYLAIGVRFLFSPSRAFDEVAYRLANPDVDGVIASGGFVCGFEHYLQFGRAEKREAAPIKEISRGLVTHPAYSDAARVIRPEFDARWYLDTYPDVAEAIENGVHPTPFMHYLIDGIAKHYSPNDWFDERWYLSFYTDIAKAQQRGGMPCGFFHYVSAGRTEGRHPKSNTLRELEDKYPGVTRPIALETLTHVEAKIAPIKVALTLKGTKRLNVLVPTLDKNIMFGGYIALLNFLVAMQERGWPIRILVLEDGGVNPDLSRLQFAADAKISRLLAKAEIVNVSGRDRALQITAGDRFLAYSMWMAHHAHRLAELTGRRYLFFLQEFEPIFHAYDSWHALGASAYLKPHFAIFNSPLLRRYFRERRYGVYAESAELGDASSAVFEHALSVNAAPTIADLDHDGQKRLLFYARPEAHAARNLFEIGIIALRRAIAAGVFGHEWSFDGVGSLGCEQIIDLGHGRFMELRPKLELKDYSAALRRYDLGLSLMYAPHPSVVPFEMAASGLVVVTNVFENRDKKTLTDISSNIVPADLSIEDITEALRTAQKKTSDLNARVAGALRPWTTDWRASFSKTFLDAVEKELG